MIPRLATAIFLFFSCTAASAAVVRPNTNADENLASAQAFLAENHGRPGVQQTASGLQYRVIQAGTGCHPSPDAPVQLQYELRFAGDETLVDTSYGLDQPVTSNLKDMIPAWEEGIPLMEEGAIWEFFIPPALGYGAEGSPPAIGPNVVLVFKVELIKAGKCSTT